MKAIILACVLLVGNALGHRQGASGQAPRPGNYGNQYNNNYGQRPPNNAAGAYLYASPSNTVLVGAPVNLTCKFTTSSYPQSISFLISDNVRNPNQLIFDTRSLLAGVPVKVIDNVYVVIYDSSISLMFYKTLTSDSGVYQCCIANGSDSNQLPLTVTYQLPTAASCFAENPNNPNKNKTTLIVAITVPLVIVLAVIITMVVMRFHCGYRFYGMFQFRRMRQSAAGADLAEVEKKAPVDKIEVLNPAKLPSYDIAAKAASESYLPPGYDEAVYADLGQTNAGIGVHVNPSGAIWKGNVV